MSDIAVRRAVRADANALFAMLRALARFHGREASISRETFIDHGWLEPARFDAWIAETSASEPIGFAQGFGQYSTWSGDEVFYLANLWVNPDCRTGGVGTALMAVVEHHARATGRSRVELLVDRSNPACAFYRRLGLQERNDERFVRETGV
ncbi:GNAT family N-acetyltransferase [Thalassobaculum sp.]|uniref:GNAT family N-acetyltransferase n=1 Tax=Thalassobaculum sp. TaxID=2022740 RepID=UPI0032F002FF